MTRWTHGHTAASGLAAGLILDRHAFLIFAAGIVLGALLVVVRRNVRTIAHAARDHAGELHRLTVDRLAAETERKRAAAAEAVSKADHRVRRAAEQAEAERKAYWRGAVDGQP